MADWTPQSRVEEILFATINGEPYDGLPQSRIEELLLELKAAIEAGGGGGGTTNYNLLSNLPQINDIVLKGNKTAEDLNLVLAEVGKGLSTNDYSNEEKAKVANLLTAIQSILDGTDIDSFGDVEIALLDKADISDLGTAAAKDSTNAVTAGSTDLVESGAVKDAIDSAVAAAYHHAGTKTVAQLTHDLLIKANEGNVYNITDSGTTTSDFIEGIGKQIDAGDNVGICKVGDVYMFDLLSGFVDTTNFVQKSQTTGLLKNDGTVNEEIEDDVDSLKSGLTNLDVALSVPEGTGKNLIGMTLDRIKALNTTGTWSGNSYTINGVTFTVDTDGNGRVIGIITDGTASGGNVDFVFSDSIIVEPNTNYIVTGCPNGGGASTYRIRVYESTWGQAVYDAGSGFSFNSGTYTWTGARITVYNGVDVTGKTFYPMVRLASVSDPTFAPYIPSVESRIEDLESGLDTVKSGLTNVESAITPVMPSSNVTYIPFGNCVAITGSLNGNDDTSLPLGIPTNYYGVVMGRFTSTGKMSLYYVDSGYLRGWDGTTNRTFPSTDAITIHGILTFTQ